MDASAHAATSDPALQGTLVGHAHDDALNTVITLIGSSDERTIIATAP
ncbi:hypothetical protein [Acrocarpospora catenulata]|nr:hypothetical protein [Acrocarpospora catenulata]